MLIAECMIDDRYGYPHQCSLLGCKNCGLIETAPYLSDFDLPALYEKYYLRKSVDLEQLHQEGIKHLGFWSRFERWVLGLNHLGQFKAKKNDVVLDFGAGACISLLQLRVMGADAYGLEADPSIKRIANRFNLNVYIGKFSDSPYTKMKFDLVVLNQVIEHLTNPSETLRALRSVLREDVGKISISCPNTDSFYRYLFQKKWINWHLPFHRFHFNKYSLKLMAEKCGYEVFNLKTITPNAWTEIQIQVLLNKHCKFLASDLWVDEISFEANQKKFINRVLRKVVWLLLPILVSIFNRFIDFCGFGDSLSCELRPKNYRQSLNKESA